VSFATAITLPTTKAAWYTRTFSRKPTHPSALNHILSPRLSNSIHTQPSLTYAQITKQNILASTQIENESHTNLLSPCPQSPHPSPPNTDILELKTMMKGHFNQLTIPSHHSPNYTHITSQSLQIALWNANGLSQHRNELQMFLHTYNIDILLISETHFTSKSFFHLPHYITYHTNHPARTARGGTAILIKNSIQHHLHNPYSQDYLQATNIALEGSHGLITISAVYLPSKHTITQELLSAFYATLGHRFLAGGH
jgi:hypothetical protein